MGTEYVGETKNSDGSPLAGAGMDNKRSGGVSTEKDPSPSIPIHSPLHNSEAEDIRTSNSEPTRASERAELELKYGARHLIQLLIPISISVFLTLVILNFVSAHPMNYKPSQRKGLLPLKKGEKEAGIPSQVIQALIILAVLIVLTFLILLLYVFRLYTVMMVFFLVQGVMISLFLSAETLLQSLKALNMPADHISCWLLIWNVGLTGLLAAFWKGPLLIQQFYYILLSSITAVFFVIRFPYWTVWLLAALLAVWDLIAVLTPCGPLRVLINKMAERTEQGEKMRTQGLMYSAGWIFMAEAEEPGSNAIPKEDTFSSSLPLNPQESANSSTDEMETTGAKLGLGDFVFYNMMIGNSSFLYNKDHAGDYSVDWTTTLACFIGVIVGLCITLILLSAGCCGQRMLPALPISIIFGLVFHFTTSEFISPFCENLASYQYFL